ncbi:cyclic 2,3-diphosphoglycerate synthase [Patescibacteria group bacterium]|nr:cyclic 2,3-diphosphoglycerate synthase [Patescibacteria group bacterium]MBU1075438.1 cyclic 2,3-diphosphoglycerate synthase [Patescibacteria group bacterium]MBU1952007.1 cyclic 2,3-diphosphoglycerate synthase [Patescibacteria group bacterium]
MARRRIVILGAAGRDFHNFNCVYRDNEKYEVVAFTATQIPDIDGRRYPAELAGELYPDGIPIIDQGDLDMLMIQNSNVDECVFAYSDVTHQHVMQMAAQVNTRGADFRLLGHRSTMITSSKPVIAVCAVRTGCGKSQTTRHIAGLLREAGLKVASIRHPMPYGDLAEQAVQRFATLEDLSLHHCTIEEMEEYEPHIIAGGVVFSGVDYGAILAEAEKEADVILWDGGNNDTPFYKPDLHIVIVDPLRLGHELSYYPGYDNLLMADVVIIGKGSTANPETIAQLLAAINEHNPDAHVVEDLSPIAVEDFGVIRGKRVLVIEDGPTTTHGGMATGAGTVAAQSAGATIIDPRPYLAGSLRDTFEKYPDIGHLLPAMGYGVEQIRDLQATISAMVKDDAIDAVVIGTPIDLTRIVKIPIACVRVTYGFQEKMPSVLGGIIHNTLANFGK